MFKKLSKVVNSNRQQAPLWFMKKLSLLLFTAFLLFRTFKKKEVCIYER